MYLADILINGQYFMHEMVHLTLFSPLISGQSKTFSSWNKENEKKEKTSKYLFQAFINFAPKFLFYSFKSLHQPFDNLFFPVNMINHRKFMTIASSTIQSFSYNFDFPISGHLQLANKFFLHQRCPLIRETTVLLLSRSTINAANLIIIWA